MDIVFFGGMDWVQHRKTNVHHIVPLLARNHRVFYIDNFGGLRGLTLKDLPRAIVKLQRILGSQLAKRTSVTAEPTDIVVLQPFIVPTPRLNSRIRRLNAWLLRRAIKKLTDRYDICDPIIWTLVPSDIVWESITDIPRSALVYQAIDRFPYSPMIPEFARPRLEYFEHLFCQSADVVFASAHGLFLEKQRINPNTHFFPNGVDPELFSVPSGHDDPLRHVSRPIIGFVGSLGPWVDYNLLRLMATMTPKWSYVIIGPVNAGIDLKPLKALPNVHFTGAVPHAALPSYLASFDCGLIPYLINHFTDYTFPSKMAEYLAAGLPVFSTPLPELQPYAAVVTCAPDARGITAAIGSHFDKPDSQMSRVKRLEIARALSWESMVSQMEELIEEAIDGKP